MIKNDPEYDFVEPMPQQPFGVGQTKKGIQCGECGMKFEYNQNYGFYCGNTRCPTGCGSR